MTLNRSQFAAALFVNIALSAVTPANAAPCTAADFASAVDKSGSTLRAFTLEAHPKLQDRMRRYSELKKLPASGYEDAALDAIQDSTLAAFDEKSAAMLLRIDSLGRVAEGESPDCSKLDDVKALSRELLGVMKAKSDYMLAALDAKIAAAGGGETAAKDKAEPAPKSAAPKPSLEKRKLQRQPLQRHGRP